MSFAGFKTLLITALAVWFVLAPAAEAQLFRSNKRKRKPMRRASEMIHRQPPPVINPGLADVINSSNSRVLISLSKQRVYLMVGDEVYIDSPISSGKRAGMTPTGSFTILEKDPDHRSNIYGDFVDRQGRVVRSGISTKVDSAPSGTSYRGAPMFWFMRMTWSGVGMHVGILPGYPASHGCIRLPADIAKMIYEKVKIGTSVTVVN